MMRSEIWPYMTEQHTAGTLITGETTNGETICYNYDTQLRLIFMVYNYVDYSMYEIHREISLLWLTRQEIQ